MKFDIEPATDGKHKFIGIFDENEDGGREKRVPFGDKSYQDLTQHHNRIRKSQYLARHRAREDWNDPMTAGSLSRWILWNTPSLQQNISLFKQRFHLE